MGKALSEKWLLEGGKNVTLARASASAPTIDGIGGDSELVKY